MTEQFTESCRQFIAERCAAFSRIEAETTSSLKRAAVAIVLAETDSTPNAAGFLLTRRAARLRAHAGQWALPGGRCDAGETLVAAARREVEEEIGLKLTEQDVLGILDDYPTRSGYLITPVVFWSRHSAKLLLSQDEVAAVYRIPLAAIEKADAVSFLAIEQSDRPVVRLRINDRFIHAPTAAILYQFREVLAGRATRVAHLEQPPFAWR